MILGVPSWGWARAFLHGLRGHNVGMDARGWVCGTCGVHW